MAKKPKNKLPDEFTVTPPTVPGAETTGAANIAAEEPRTEPVVVTPPREYRQVHSHHAGNAASELRIIVRDDPGAGGANHVYAIDGFQSFDGILAASAFTLIRFQNGPIPTNGLNGITNEVLLAIVQDRLKCFQNGPFACAENAAALMHTTEALYALHARTRDRMARNVEGTNGK